ncbi:MAG: ABC transporter substrate-binding protein [Synechococcaceae cyanobacterium]|nr:ABC transporter substrate-binding protein [Synechococcaceae cyanobacterium]
MPRRWFIDRRHPLVRRRFAPLLVGLALLLSACGREAARLGPTVNLQVLISAGRLTDQIARENLKKIVAGEVNDFMRSNPGVQVHTRYVLENDVLETMRKRSSLGTGPDLMVTSVPLALALYQEGMSVPGNLTAQQLASLKIRHLDDFRDGERFVALPFLVQPNLVCYNRKAIASPPTSLAQLLVLAEQGRRIGLSLVMDQLLWSGHGFAAQEPILRLFDASPETPAGRALSPADRPRVLAWLRWLYRANVHPNMQFSDTNEDLAKRFLAREIDWMTCNAVLIPNLRRVLGADLGLAQMPGPEENKPAPAVARMTLLSFGRDSSGRQREAAQRFAEFLLNDYSQSTLMTAAIGNLPVNGNVIIPIKKSAEMRAINEAETLAIVPTFHRAVGVRQQREPLMRLLKQNVYGELSPQEVLVEIEALAAQRKPPAATTMSTAGARPLPANATRSQPASSLRVPQTSRP